MLKRNIFIRLFTVIANDNQAKKLTELCIFTYVTVFPFASKSMEKYMCLLLKLFISVEEDQRTIVEIKFSFVHLCIGLLVDLRIAIYFFLIKSITLFKLITKMVYSECKLLQISNKVQHLEKEIIPVFTSTWHEMCTLTCPKCMFMMQMFSQMLLKYSLRQQSQEYIVKSHQGGQRVKRYSAKSEANQWGPNPGYRAPTDITTVIKYLCLSFFICTVSEIIVVISQQCG